MVFLVESWATPEATQPDRIGDRLGLEHRLFVGDPIHCELLGATATPE
jgi:hypothetical protein